jgi:hypothetical protein
MKYKDWVLSSLILVMALLILLADLFVTPQPYHGMYVIDVCKDHGGIVQSTGVGASPHIRLAVQCVEGPGYEVFVK